MKEKAILVGPFVGEFFWEFFRFVPHIIYNKNTKHKDTKIIVLTREDRFDLYGLYADILVPMRIENDEKYNQNSYRLDGYSSNEYNEMIDLFKSTFANDFDIIEVIRPDISKGMFARKDQYKPNQMIYDYRPRPSNRIMVENFLGTNKKNIVIAPRFRTTINKRNWPYWQELYDMIWNSNLKDKFNFVICGKSPDYIPDKYNRFMDMNNIPQNINTSSSGILIEIMKRSIFTIGSQSAIPNISLLFGIEALEWGHQKQFHTIDYNIKNSKVTFLEDFEYKISPQIVFKKMYELLEDK